MTFFYITGSCRDAIEGLNNQRHMAGYPMLSVDRQLCTEESAQKTTKFYGLLR